MAWTRTPYSLLGLRVAGDLNGETIYTDRRFRKVHYAKAPPHKPPSQEQLLRRDLFRRAVAAWRALSEDEKAALEQCARRLKLCATGQNIYTSCSLRARPDLYATLSQQSGIDLPPLALLQ